MAAITNTLPSSGPALTPEAKPEASAFQGVASRALILIGIIFLSASIGASSAMAFGATAANWQAVQSVFFMGLAAFITGLNLLNNQKLTASVSVGGVTIGASTASSNSK